MVDFGPASADRVDYPDYAFKVAEAVARRKAERGVLVCSTGVGMSIAANKVRGVRAALVDSVRLARLLTRAQRLQRAVPGRGRRQRRRSAKRILGVWLGDRLCRRAARAAGQDSVPVADRKATPGVPPGVLPTGPATACPGERHRHEDGGDRDADGAEYRDVVLPPFQCPRAGP